METSTTMVDEIRLSPKLYGKTVGLINCFMRSNFVTTVFVCSCSKRASVILEKIKQLNLPIEISLFAMHDERNTGILIKKIIH